MGSRVIEFNTGIETSTLPDPGTPSNSADVLTKGYADSNYGKKIVVTGTYAAPTALAAGDSIAHNLTSTDDEGLAFVQGSGGAVDLSSVPQIVVPTRVGQKLTVVGCHDVNTVKLEHGDGLHQNGEVILAAKDMIHYIALTLTEWAESGRP